MSLRERVGQLLMVDSPSTAVGGATRTAVEAHHVGAVILDGTSTAGVSTTRDVTDRLRRLAPRDVGLLIATDQEGGQVQRLQGAGFTRVPSAVAQGALTPSTLQHDAQQWGDELRRAGVDVDLAPVLDTVPPGTTHNPPIGDLDREYGRHPDAVSTHGVAVLRGLAAAHVAATAKHFPGLGRVAGNTDTTAGVTDTATTRNDAYLAPFRAAVQAHVPFVMMSTAIYRQLDPGTPAAFSQPIVTGMLRERLGFRGVVISDDVGAAKQVARYSPGERAVRFVAAGGDMVLTVDASQAGEMCDALVARATSDKTFRTLVDAAALRVLQAKQAFGLLR
ncbi:glycoside hydrolase family 3 N-terminal domain-containing protein [uncultured Jatrophihabitans sp.]|uniref:glycoside hydrolase family 3 N-terminal domain-containing protein n=1 Tax=uncultured Jatrophihabitans sp. TaxID=1610747 RepID=UPI0035CB3DCC